MFLCFGITWPLASLADEQDGYQNYIEIFKYTKAGEGAKTRTLNIAPVRSARCFEEGYCMDVYLFADSTVDLSIECSGALGTLDDGGWIATNVQLDEQGEQCFKNVTVCYDEDAEDCMDSDQISHIDYSNAKPASAYFSSSYEGRESTGIFSHCHSPDGATYKEYCLWEYAPSEDQVLNNKLAYRASSGEDGPTTGFTGNTGDDMFKIARNEEGFLEYIDFDQNSEYNLKYIRRGDNGNPADSSDLMIPAGPKADRMDYANFMENPSEEMIVTNACFPTRVTIDCGQALVYFYSVEGRCGFADGNTVPYGTTAEGLPFCKNGFVYSPTYSATGIEWFCVPAIVEEYAPDGFEENYETCSTTYK